MNDPEDEMANNILATGAVAAALAMSTTPAIQSVIVKTSEGMAQNQLFVKFDFLKSAYRLTIERVEESETAGEWTCPRCLKTHPFEVSNCDSCEALGYDK